MKCCYVLLAFLAIWAAAPQSARAQGDGTLSAVAGKVWHTPLGGKQASARQGMSVAPGGRLRTAEGQATVRFQDGSELKLHANSEIVLSKSQRKTTKKRSVLLVVGRLWNKVARTVGGDGGFEVSTANAVCGVRGTEFETVVADDGALRVQVHQGAVDVEGDSHTANLGAGQGVQADEKGVGTAHKNSSEGDYQAWRKSRRERLRKNGKAIIEAIKGRIMGRKDKIVALRQRQQAIESRRTTAEERARRGDQAALDEVREYNQQLAELADAIADLGDQAEAQFGIVDHFADLAQDPRFGMVGRKNIEAEAKSLRRVKADLDKLIAEGTDISMKSMDKLLDDMSSGQRGSMRDKGGSAADDLFGGESMDPRK